MNSVRNKENILAVCDLCGKNIPKTSNALISEKTRDGKNINICFDCIESYYKEMSYAIRKRTNLSNKSQQANKLRPSAIKAYLDEYIIGQEKAKKILSVAIYNHYKMIKMKQGASSGSIENDLEKSNILLVGPSGCGKTAVVKRLAKKLGVPFVICDSTTFTAAGYVGKDLETIFRDLIIATGKSGQDAIKAAEHGIVYIDEIDKISRKGENLSTTSDPGNEAVQQGLLKMLEGSVVTVPLKGDRLHPQADSVEINTENILFIVGGSFEDIEKIIAKRKHMGKGSIGFGSEIIDKEKDDYNDLIVDITTDDLRKFGMLPEFLGRLPVICPMQRLDEDALISILTEPKNAITKQYQKLLERDGVDLSFSRKALIKIAKEAIKRKTGARSLRSIVESIMNDVMYELPDNEDIDKVNIDIDKNNEFIIKKINTDNDNTGKEVLKNG